MIGKALTKMFGSKNDREVKELRKIVAVINDLEPSIEPLSDIQLQEKTVEFRERVAKGEPLDDLLPEAFLGPAGFLEDVVLAAAVLSVALGPDLEAIAEGYWNGSQRLRVVLRDVSEVAYNVLGHNLYVRLQRLLARRGIHLG